MSETTSNTIPKASGSTPGGVRLKGRIEEVSHRSEAPVMMAGAIDNKVLAGRPAGQMQAEIGSGGLNEAAALNSQEIGADKESATGVRPPGRTPVRFQIFQAGYHAVVFMDAEVGGPRHQKGRLRVARQGTSYA